MNTTTSTTETTLDAGLSDVIKIAILAVGGQGGGVLTNWIAELAQRGGYRVQATSVAGVAQRTGATIYYIEMAPKAAREAVFAQSPAPGDVDIMIAAELMEAGRAVLRGFVTPDRTTLIASNHRILAVSEKQVPGDGRVDAPIVEQEITAAALKTVCFDMESIAVDAGSVISSSLFGALAKSKTLPFPATMYEEVIQQSGRAVEPSLAAFRATLAYSSTEQPKRSQPSKPLGSVKGPEDLLSRWQQLIERTATIDSSARFMVQAGLRKVVDYQDVDYGAAYLDVVLQWHSLDDIQHNFELTKVAAKYIANAMCYDDIIRVADLKIRSSRQARLRREQQVNATDIVHVTEYFHPRAEEISATLPASLGAFIQTTPWAFKLLDKLVNRGRRVRTDRAYGFFTLWLLARLKRYRLKLLRHQQETKHLNRLIGAARDAVNADYALAVELFKCQRLIKGYSDTHARGHSKFDRVFDAVNALEAQHDAAQWLEKIREAALNDETGAGFDRTLAQLHAMVKSNNDPLAS